MIDERVKEVARMNNSAEVFDFLVDFLGYKDSPNFHIKKDSDFDAEYSIKVEGKEYTIAGIKIFRVKDEEAIVKQHLKYWNQNEVPFSILVLEDEIRIYNNFTINKKKQIYTSYKKDDELIRLFSNHNIINGLFWEKLHSFIKKGDRVDSYLLNNLRNTMIDLYKNHHMALEDAYNFVAQCIFVKYMEDRGMLTESAFVSFNVTDFHGLLNLNNVEAIKDFFTELKEWFNGDLFDVERMCWPNASQLNVIRSFFEADEIYGNGIVQYSLFKYDFSRIPIELISNIYETFFQLDDRLLDKNYSSKNGAFYTPYYLADFMNDRCFEQLCPEGIPVVLDPACGSGVFLVGAFRRIADRIRSAQNGISAKELGDILLYHIFGVDLNPKALKLTCFSLYIALLEYLTPKDILKNEFKFPNLIGRTLFCSNFFNDELRRKRIKADIIIGNPPWVSDKSGEHNAFCKENQIPISDGQIAQAFVGGVKDFVREDTVISLIVTNSMLTNEHARNFRKFLFSKYHVLEIFNLSRVRGSLFSHASAPCSILTYRCDEVKEAYSFQYYSFRPNLLSDTFHRIVYDKEECIRLNNYVVMDRDYSWRVLTNGDEYDVRVIDKMKSYPSVRDRGFEYFRGYAVGNRSSLPKEEFLKYKGGNLQEGFHQYFMDYQALPQMKECCFERSRSLEGYLCNNKLLVKRTQNARLSGAAYCVEPVIFSDDYHCLYSMDGREEELKLLTVFFNSRIFSYYLFFASKMASAIKPEITKDDILSFPVPDHIGAEDRKRLLESLNQIELLLCDKFGKGPLETYEMDAIEQKIDDIQREMDHLILSIYQLDPVEQAAVEYAMSYVVPGKMKQEKRSQSWQKVNAYEGYTRYVEDYFNNFLSGSGLVLHHLPVCSKHLFTLISFRVEPEDSDEDEKGGRTDDQLIRGIIDLLGLSSIENIDSELIVKNRISGFLEDGFFVIKENDIRKWTYMDAVRDTEYFARIILNENGEALLR